MIKVNRYTRAGMSGKAIYCPHCKDKVIVGHFAWSAIRCSHCKVDVQKHEWDYPPENVHKD